MKKPLLMDEVAAHLDIVAKQVTKIVGTKRPNDPKMNCDIAVIDWLCAWREHRSLVVARGFAWRAWEYFGGLERHLSGPDNREWLDDCAEDRRARDAASAALSLLGAHP